MKDSQNEYVLLEEMESKGSDSSLVSNEFEYMRFPFYLIRYGKQLPPIIPTIHGN